MLITGANTGIGRAAAEALAARGAKMLLACRSEEKTRPELEGIRTKGGAAEIVPLDLASLQSVRDCAAGVLGRAEPLHVLINNAGLAGKRGKTRDGFELAFGTNHLGHFLLTQLLLPKLRANAPARVVNVASHSHFNAHGIDFDHLRQKSHLLAVWDYNVSKLCNVLFTKELARREAKSGVTTYSLHPGVVASDAWREMPWPIRPLIKRRMISPEEGSRTTVFLASAPVETLENGGYYSHSRISKSINPIALDTALAAKLWEQSAAWAGLPPA